MTTTTSNPTTTNTPHAATPAAPVAPNSGVLRALGLGEVRITGGFWGHRQQVNGSASLPHIEHWDEREGWLANFDLAAAGRLPEGRRGREFSDSEVYKLLEAMAWEVARTDDTVLEARFRALVTRITAAQEPDGYLNTNFGRPGQQPRWSNLEWGHELYCAGHLIQAAVARARTRPQADDGLLDVACRVADLVCDTFGADGIVRVCGHPVIEVALAELARVTGRAKYLSQASLFIDRRGHGTLEDIEWGRAYYQDDIPIREADVLRGHAVRAGYLAAGAVDVAVETGDDELLAALVTQWDNTVARRTYLTGGQGSHHQDEAFGDDWVLPPDRAYSETCAGVASIMFSWRLMLATGHAKYADLIERTLFNVIANSPDETGTAFFYANTLHQRRPGTVPATDVSCPRAQSSLRAPWYAVSCCPPNVARTLASLASYVATTDAAGLQVHQFTPAQIRCTLPDGRRIEVDIETAYPTQGTVRVIVANDSDQPWTLTLRVPHWAHGATLASIPCGGQEDYVVVSPGLAAVTRNFQSGDVVELRLPMDPRLTAADPRIDAVRGCLAIERGPEVLCLESTDLLHSGIDTANADVGQVALAPNPEPRESNGQVIVSLRVATASSPGPIWPYGAPDGGFPATRDVRVALIPYHDWANRGPSTMRIWIPTTPDQKT